MVVILVMRLSLVHVDSIIANLHLHFVFMDLGILYYFLGAKVTYNVLSMHLS